MELLLSQGLFHEGIHYHLGLGGWGGRLRWSFQVRVGLEKRGWEVRVGLFGNRWPLQLRFVHFLSQWLNILTLYLTAKIFYSHIN